MSTAASSAETIGAGRRPLELVGRICTRLLVAQLAVSGLLLIARPNVVVTTVRHLGYPDYFSPMLGVAKLLAALAIAHPRGRMLAEWAYAGATFDVIAVVVSHAALRDSVPETLAPFSILAVIAASCRAFHERRETP